MAFQIKITKYKQWFPDIANAAPSYISDWGIPYLDSQYSLEWPYFINSIDPVFFVFRNAGVKPSLLHATQHIFENIKSISSECPENANQGFWLMIIGKKYMDTFWSKACRLYRDLKLPGIAFLMATPGRAGSSTGTIRFFCGPIRDLSRLERIGINLARKLNYKNPKEELQFRVQNSNANQSTVFYTVKVPKLSDARYANWRYCVSWRS